MFRNASRLPKFTGLVRKLSAPPVMASTASGMSPVPVTTTSTADGHACLSSGISETPFPSGSHTSRSTASNLRSQKRRRASASEPASTAA